MVIREWFIFSRCFLIKDKIFLAVFYHIDLSFFLIKKMHPPPKRPSGRSRLRTPACWKI